MPSRQTTNTWWSETSGGFGKTACPLALAATPFQPPVGADHLPIEPALRAGERGWPSQAPASSAVSEDGDVDGRHASGEARSRTDGDGDHEARPQPIGSLSSGSAIARRARPGFAAGAGIVTSEPASAGGASIARPKSAGRGRRRCIGIRAPEQKLRCPLCNDVRVAFA